MPASRVHRISVAELFRLQLKKIQADKRILGLWITELFLAVILAGAIAVYLDPDLNVVPFPWNVVAFALILAAAIYLHSFTRPFRVPRRLRKE